MYNYRMATLLYINLEQIIGRQWKIIPEYDFP
jgi:hypothetical protein